MHRSILLQLIAAGVMLLCATHGSYAADADAILGDWHLLLPSDDEVQVPSHRMDLRFKSEAGQLKGAILNRNDGSEIPLASAAFDGTALHFQMLAPSGKAQSDMPTMVMNVDGRKFEGAWTNAAGEKLGPTFKLVRRATK